MRHLLTRYCLLYKDRQTRDGDYQRVRQQLASMSGKDEIIKIIKRIGQIGNQAIKSTIKNSKEIARNIIELCALLLIVYGCYTIYNPLGYIIFGLGLLAISYKAITREAASWGNGGEIMTPPRYLRRFLAESAWPRRKPKGSIRVPRRRLRSFSEFWSDV